MALSPQLDGGLAIHSDGYTKMRTNRRRLWARKNSISARWKNLKSHSLAHSGAALLGGTGGYYLYVCIYVYNIRCGQYGDTVFPLKTIAAKNPFILPTLWTDVFALYALYQVMKTIWQCNNMYAHWTTSILDHLVESVWFLAFGITFLKSIEKKPYNTI